VTRVLAISACPGEVRAVLLEKGRAVELHVEREAEGSLVDALFLGRILRVVSALPGAFVELGLDRPAFLPGDKLPDGGALIEGATILVQVVKDAFDDKAPEVSAAPSFHGKLAVWTPGKPGIAVSRQVAPAERARLSALLEPLVKPGEGVVLRSRAAGAKASELAGDIERLRADHQALTQAVAGAKPPVRIDPAPGALERIVIARGQGVDRILIDDRAAHVALRRSLGIKNPLLVERIELDLAVGFTERHGLDDAFEQALATRIGLADGAEIVIESGVAFTAMDVNLGAAASGRGRAAEAIRRVNLAAATEIARQLRLRNVGGAIVIDFVSMQVREHRREVEAAFTAAAEHDPMPIELHGWTRLGHLEVTRKRSAASIADLMLIQAGGRRAKTALTVALEVLRSLSRASFRPGPLEVRLHGTVAAELKSGLAQAFETTAGHLGRHVTLKIEPDRDPETFDIGSA
jgi:ribonuclease G